MSKKYINLPMSLKTYIDDVRASEGKLSFRFLTCSEIEVMDEKLDLKNQTIRDLGVIFQNMYGEFYKHIINEYVKLDNERHSKAEGYNEERFKEVLHIYKNLNNYTFNETVDKLTELNITMEDKFKDKCLAKLQIPYSVLTIEGTEEEIKNGFDISKIRLTDSTHVSEVPLKIWKYLYDNIN